MRLLKLAFKLLRRDWKSGELRILISALLIGVISTTAISFFTERVQLAMLDKAANVLGGDLVVTSSRTIDKQWEERAINEGLQVANTLGFPSMAVFNDEFQLCSIKAVDEQYPLRGALKLRNQAGELIDKTGAPARGEAWVENRVLYALEMQLGDSIEVGEIQLRVTHAIELEPDRGSGFYALSPRLMMNLADIPAANVIQAGSRVKYRQLYAGEADAVNFFKQWLEPKLTVHDDIVTARAGRPAVRNAIARAERFLNLSSFIAVLLSSVAIAIATQQYARRHFDTSALLRCFGARQNEVFQIFLIQLALLGFITSTVACIVGFVAQFGITELLKSLLPSALPYGTFKPVLLGYGTAFCMLLGFALPPIMKLRNVPPLRALKRDLAPQMVSNGMYYSIAAFFLIVLLIIYTRAPLISLAIIIGGSIGFAAFAAMSWLLFRGAEKLTRSRSFILRNSIKNLRRHAGLTISQITAFGLTFLAIALVALIRTDLITSWKQQLPDKTPNHFAINIVAERIDAFQQYLESNAIESSQLYPITRGRLVSINGVSVRQAVSKEENSSGSTERELNITWSDTIQPENKLIDGKWWPELAPSLEKQVSIESQVAERLGIKVGDQVGFILAGRSFDARVTSLRAVRWESFRPNFYMIFKPGDLDEFEVTYMTSFYVDADQKNLIPEMIDRFSGITLFEVDVLLKQVRDILTQVTLAIESIFVFVVLSGVVVLLAAIQASLNERLHEGALWRSLGASRSEIRKMQIFEFFVIGFLAGLLATLCLEIISYLLYTRIFNLDYELKWFLWPVTWVLSTIIIVIAGVLGTRQVISTSPLLLLRE